MDLIRKKKLSSRLLYVISPSQFLNALPIIACAISASFNSSLSSGRVPPYFKHATIQTILKKTNLDPALPINYRPILKPPFLLNILEKIMENQLTSALKRKNIFDKFQSGFQKEHSAETALLRISNDFLIS